MKELPVSTLNQLLRDSSPIPESPVKDLDFVEPVKGPHPILSRPSIFDYSDYRKFLADMMEFKKAQNNSFSESAFLRQAGFGQNSRGYFGLIVKGKRNLSSHTLLGFAQACRLNEGEIAFFESLVHYNQAKTEKDKTFYFERLLKLNKNHHSKSFELLESQYKYLSNWYFVAIRELVGLKDFKEDGEWISQKLRKKVSGRVAMEAITHLLQLGMLKRDEHGKLTQSENFLEFTDSSLNYTVANIFHKQILELAAESLEHDRYEDRSLSTVMLACDQKNFPEIRKKIREFREMILKTYGVNNDTSDAVLNLSIQLLHVTPIKRSTK